MFYGDCIRHDKHNNIVMSSPDQSHIYKSTYKSRQVRKCEKLPPDDKYNEKVTRVPRMELVVEWPVNTLGNDLQLSTGDTLGYTFHADFISGWDEDLLRFAIRNCKDTNSVGDYNGCNLRKNSENLAQVRNFFWRELPQEQVTNFPDHQLPWLKAAGSLSCDLSKPTDDAPPVPYHMIPREPYLECETTDFKETAHASAASAWSVAVGDLDGDLIIDVAAAARRDDSVLWYKTYDNVTFGEPIIVDSEMEKVESVATADLDNDGHLDLIAAAFKGNAIAWYQNDGLGNFTKFNISTEVQGPSEVIAADIDSDNDLDILAAIYFDDELVYFENSGLTFTKKIIARNLDGARSVAVADLDRDGYLDVMAASYVDNTISWFKNSGGPSIQFTKRPLATGAKGAYSVAAGDMDGDGFIDILSASQEDKKLAWYKSDGSLIPTFTRYDITTTAAGAWFVDAVDIDGDTDLDVLLASEDDDTLALYENDGTVFTPRILSASADGARAMATADFDGDLDLDCLGASWRDSTIGLFQNDCLPVTQSV